MRQAEFGGTAWGRSWLRAIEPAHGMPNPRLPKARSLARNQKAVLTFSGTAITSTVHDGGTKHDVVIELARWSRQEQQAANAVLASERQPETAGDLPDRLSDQLNSAGAPVAVTISRLKTTCTCLSRADQCAHVLAALYSLVLLVDERPATALEIRLREQRRSRDEHSEWVPLTAIDAAAFFADPTRGPT